LDDVKQNGCASTTFNESSECQNFIEVQWLSSYSPRAEGRTDVVKQISEFFANLQGTERNREKKASFPPLVLSFCVKGRQKWRKKQAEMSWALRQQTSSHADDEPH
jgi:hypothetical protein